MNNFSLLASTVLFAELCETEDSGLFKIAIIRKLPKGYWGIFSQKGKLLGKYKTKTQALKRLRQIEFFKHKKASKDEVTYSALMREITKQHSPEVLRQFRVVFKEAFDDAIIHGKENAEEIALNAGLQFLDSLEDHLEKAASAIEMGDPVYAGKYIAEIIKFLLRRISPERRQKSLSGLRRKIYMLNEVDIAQKKMPASAALGQAISLTKNLLMMHSPDYVRTVLNSIVRHLG